MVRSPQRCKRRATHFSGRRKPFEWRLPPHFNFGRDIVDRAAAHWPDGNAIVALDEGRRERRFTFSEVARLTDQLAAALLRRGLARGDRVVIILPRVPRVAPRDDRLPQDRHHPYSVRDDAERGRGRVPYSPRRGGRDRREQRRCCEARRCDRCSRVLHQRRRRARLGEPCRASRRTGQLVSTRFDEGHSSCDPLVHVGLERQPEGSASRFAEPVDPLLAAVAVASPKTRRDRLGDDRHGLDEAATSLLFGTFCHGATAFLVERPVTKDIPSLVARYGISCLCLSATELRRLVENLPLGGSIPSLRLAVSAGEAVTADLFGKWMR